MFNALHDVDNKEWNIFYIMQVIYPALHIDDILSANK